MAEVKNPKPLDVNTLPSNSKTPKSKKADKNVEKVVKARVKTKEKATIQKMGDAIFSTDDVEHVRTYILWDVIVPAIKNALWNVISGGSEMLIFGDKGNRRGENRRDNYVNYSKPSYATSRRNDEQRRSSAGPRDFREIIFESRGDASDVLDNMYELIVDYGEVSVADLYDLVGITGNFTDNKYGWFSLDSVDIRMARGGGYILDLPRVERLD